MSSLQTAVRYSSTRGGVRGLSFTETVVSGLAEDGGLLVPDSIPKVDHYEQQNWGRLNYRDLCFQIMRKFVCDSEIPDHDLKEIIHRSYQSFKEAECVKISPLKINGDGEYGGENIWSSLYLLELFHGPTFAFKDFALQFLGQLFGYILRSTDRKILIFGATSGDTGSAAIEGCRNIENVSCVILFPEGKTSRIQELQMTTVLDPNVQCLAVSGGCFDDCQSIVKEIFSSSLKKKLNLSAINSINWARILAQIVYYWYTCYRIQEAVLSSELSHESSADVSLPPEQVDFCIPTGNFGNILAAYYAKEMGAPIGRLIIASNANNILQRFYRFGKYEKMPVISTSSPSMDIQISSNFERLLFDVVERNSAVVKEKFDQSLKMTNQFDVDEPTLKKVHSKFSAYTANEDQTAQIIKLVYDSTKTAPTPTILDPHTAVGVYSALAYRMESGSKAPLVVASTAHFGKFPETVKNILGDEVVEKYMLSELKGLEGKAQKYKTVPVSQKAIEDFLIEFCSQKKP